MYTHSPFLLAHGQSHQYPVYTYIGLWLLANTHIHIKSYFAYTAHILHRQLQLEKWKPGTTIKYQYYYIIALQQLAKLRKAITEVVYKH